MLRIIAGKYRSRKLLQPSLNTTRPTLDRVRESLFNIIQNEIKDSTVLDCFAGSGAFCLEALSRGAKKAIAIEKDKKAFEIIKTNASNLKEENIEIKNMDSFVYVKTIENIQFDFIYLDPPYKLDILKEFLNVISQRNLVTNNGKIIIETKFDTKIPEIENLIVHNERIYGKTKIVFIKLNGNN